jgi:hypothetical protein
VEDSALFMTTASLHLGAAAETATLIDMVFPCRVPFCAMALSQSSGDDLAIDDRILAYPFDHYIGGHQGRSGDRQDVINNRDYVRTF